MVSDVNRQYFFPICKKSIYHKMTIDIPFRVKETSFKSMDSPLYLKKNHICVVW